MSSVHSEVKKCDRCGALYEVTHTDPDWKISYLGVEYDMCDSCYDKVAAILKPDMTLRAANKEEK